MPEFKKFFSTREIKDDDRPCDGNEGQVQTQKTSSWVGGLRQRAKKYRDKIMSNKFAVTSKFVVCSRVLSETIPSRNCDILMTIGDSSDDDLVMWVVSRLRARVPELVVHVRHHSKTDEYGFYLTATYDNLLKGAEELSLKKRVKKEYGGGFKEFVYEDREYFEGASESLKSAFLKSEERQSIVRHLLMNLRAERGDRLTASQGGKGGTRVTVDFHEGQAIVPILLSKKIVSQVLPLHSHDDLAFLRNNWVQAFFHKQPLDRVCDYFGVKITLYFAYLGYYTKCLLWPAVIGLLFWFVGGSHQDTDDVCFVAFALFNVIWATLYLEGWKREEAIHAYHWGTMDKEDDLLVEPRALYHGEMKKSQVTGRFEPWYPVWKRNLFRYLVSFPVILACLIVVFGVMWTIIEMQSYINRKMEEDKIPGFFKFIPKVLLGLCITLLDEAYKKIALWLNNMENHRLDVTYENHLIIKLVLFQFVNSFLSLFYIAFYLRDMTQLHEHLMALLITRQVIGNLKETIQPFVVEKVRLFRLWYELVVTMGPEAIQDQMEKMTEKNRRREERRTARDASSLSSSSSSAAPTTGGGDTLDRTDSMETLDELENISGNLFSASSSSERKTDTIEEEEEEEEEDEVEEPRRDKKVDFSNDNKFETSLGEMAAIQEEKEEEDEDDDDDDDDDDDEEGEEEEEKEEGEEEREDVHPTEEAAGKIDLEEEDEDEEEEDVPELTIRESRAAVPGGFLGRKRGFGAQRYTGQRKVSLMGDVKSQLPQLKLLSRKRSSTKMSQAEVESVMKRYEDTYEDYLEMFIQFGYVTLFSSAFPLAALCAFLNNIIEIRSDAFKLCVSLQRPFGQRVQAIGIWQRCLELMSIMAVMVNSALIGMSGLAERMFPDWGTVERIVFIVILEHFVLALKLILAYAIPDVPDHVAEEKARLEFLRREALKNSWMPPFPGSGCDDNVDSDNGNGGSKPFEKSSCQGLKASEEEKISNFNHAD